MRGRNWALPALLLGTFGMAGCGHETVAQASGKPPTGDWLSISVTTGGAPKALVAGTRISLGFADGALLANAGCNSMSGSARFVGGELIVDPLVQSAMGCPDGRNEQDQFVSRFLTARPGYSHDGHRLELRTGDTDIVFGPKQAVQADPNPSGSASPAPPDGGVITPPCCKPMVTGSPTPPAANDQPGTVNTAEPADGPPGY